MEVLKGLIIGLLAGDAGLWNLLAIVALIVWVVADAAILARGVPKGIPDKVLDHSPNFDQEPPRRRDDDEEYFLHGGIKPIGYIGVGAHHDDRHTR